MEIKLTTDFLLRGYNADEFFEAIKMLEDATDVVTVNSPELEYLAIIASHDDCEEVALTANPNALQKLADIADTYQNAMNELKKENKLFTSYMNEDFTFRFRKLDISSMEKQGVSKELIHELCSESRLIIRYLNESYIVSPIAFTTLLARAGLGGDMMNHACYGRTVEIAKSLRYRKPQKINMISRKVGGARLLVGAHSEKYCYIPQTVLGDIYHKIAEDYGETSCVEWSVTHQLSYCYIGFPEIAKDFAAMYNLPDSITPGLCISTSDSGDSSIIIRGFWNVRGGRIAGESVKRKHIGSIDIDDFVQKSADSIFMNYKTIPERLCKLMEIDISDPAATLKRVFRQCGAKKILGKADSDRILMQLCAEFSPAMKYTAYDICMSIVTLPERVSARKPISHTKMEQIELLSKRAIMAGYENKEEEETEDLTVI